MNKTPESSPIALSSPTHPAATAPSGCPMQQRDAKLGLPTLAKCPVMHASDDLNPRNNVPASLSQSPAPNQSKTLSTKREHSSIPYSASPEEQGAPSTWIYPSPQQFYNALIRKGYDMPEEHMGTMVEIHNFLNEEAWSEVLQWEKRWTGLQEAPQLARIQGKPRQLSLKARTYLFASWLVPSRFHIDPPFDRHDWLIRRSTGEEVRYIIDYYSAPPDEDGNPAFSLDVRPASDSAKNITQKIMAATYHGFSRIWGGNSEA